MSKNLDLKITGNPFVDAGIYALNALNSLKIKKSKIEDLTFDNLREGLDIISDLYFKEGWNKNMYSIFPNSALTNNSIANKKEKYVEDIQELYNEIGTVTNNSNCIGCGRRNALNQYGKKDVPLYGSGTFRNYSSFMTEGADYCPLCILLIQFMPLMLYRSGGKFILLHSDSNKIMNFWSRRAIRNYNTQKAEGNYIGCFNEEYKNPVNGIFHMIEDIVDAYDRRNWGDISPSLNFYYFTNYNQGPELELYLFPNNVFRFLTYIPSEEKSNWQGIIYRQYVNIKKDETEEEYKNKKNRVYENLLNRKSILGYFFNSRKKETYCSWKLLQYYLEEVENMEKKRVDAIRDLGDNLSEYIKEDNKKTLNAIETAESYSNFLNILRKVMKDKVENGDDELLVTYDDLVNNICPDYKVWKETRDLLLFRLYENLKDWIKENNEDDNNGQ